MTPDGTDVEKLVCQHFLKSWIHSITLRTDAGRIAILNEADVIIKV
jgi:hypothetical protein